MIYSLRSEEYCYVREKLFDLREALSEKLNLAGAKRYQKTLREHRAQMKREHPDY